MSAAAFFITVATSAALFAFQQAGYVQDSSFNLFQEVNVNHDTVILPRISLFKYLISDVWFDTKAAMLSRCQTHNTVFFIEYIDGHPVFEEDTCLTVTPALLHLAAIGGDDTFHDDLLARSEGASAPSSAQETEAADLQFRAKVHDTLTKISRCIAINTYTRTLSLISGHGLSVTGNTPRDDMVPWYIGTDETYGHLVLGTQYIPYAPINNTAAGQSVEFPFFLEPLYLPAGSAVNFDAALFAPMDRVADYFNSHTPEEANTGSSDDRGSNTESYLFSENGKSSPGHKAETERASSATYQLPTSVAQSSKEPRTWELTNEQHSSDQSRKSSTSKSSGTSRNARRLYSPAGGGIRDQHWIDMCSSIANSLQPMLVMRSARDETAMEALLFPNRTYELAYLTRPFVVTSGASLSQDSTVGMMSYWLDTCSLRPPRANLLGNQRGSQAYWWESKFRRGKRRRSLQSKQEASYEMRDGEKSKRKAPHQRVSPFVSDSPCDVNYVRNMRKHVKINDSDTTPYSLKLEQRAGDLLCPEDFVMHPALVQSMDVGLGPRDHSPGAHGSSPSSAFKAGDASSRRSSHARLPSDWTVYASGRGLADLWYSDPALGRHLSMSQSPYAHFAPYYLFKEFQLFEQRYELGKGGELKRGGRSPDGMDRPLNATQASPTGQSGSSGSDATPPQQPDAWIGEVNISPFSAATASSLIQTRRDEFLELLRVLRAFGNAYMHASDERATMLIRERFGQQDGNRAHSAESHSRNSNEERLDVFFVGCPANATQQSLPQRKRDPVSAGDSKRPSSYSTRLYVRSLFRDLVDASAGKKRVPVPGLLYNSLSGSAEGESPRARRENGSRRANAYLQHTEAGRKNLNKYPGSVCDLRSALLIDVPLRPLAGAAAEDGAGGWITPKVHKTHNIHTELHHGTSTATPADGSSPPAASSPPLIGSLHRLASALAYKEHMGKKMRVARSVEEYFSDAIRAILSIPASEPRWYFSEIVHNRLGELLPPLFASPSLAAAKETHSHSLLRTNTTHRMYARDTFGPISYQRCGFVKFIDERDYTLLALSLHSALRKYFFPQRRSSTSNATPTPAAAAAAGAETSSGEPAFICEYLAAAEKASPSEEDASPFLASLKRDTYLCGPDRENAMRALLEILDLYHLALASTTQRVQDTHQRVEEGSWGQQANRTDSLHSQLLHMSTHRPAVETLGASVADLRKHTKVLVNSEPTISAEAKSAAEAAAVVATKSLNLQIGFGNVHVLLFVLPRHFALAQEYVEKARKRCACEMCFVFVHYHITILPGDGRHAQGVHHRYEEESDLQLEHYSSMHTGKLPPHPYSRPQTMAVLKYDEDDGDEDVGQSEELKVSVTAVNAADASRPPDPVVSSFEGEFSSSKSAHEDRPSLRLALLAAADMIAQFAIRSDVVQMCVGIEACLGMTIHGTNSSAAVPPVSYGGHASITLPAPLIMAQSASGSTLWPYSLGGTAYAMRTLFSRISQYDANYRYGNNYDVERALVRFAQQHTFMKLYGKDGRFPGKQDGANQNDARSDLFWIAGDVEEKYFSRPRGKRLWDAIRHPDALFAAKEIHMRVNAVNRENTNNAQSDVVDVVDSSSDSMINDEHIVFNVTYCSDITHFAKRGFSVESTLSDDEAASSRKQTAGPGHTYRVGNVYWKQHLLVGEWPQVSADRIMCHQQLSRLLITTFMDGYADIASKLNQTPQSSSDVNGVPGNTNPSVFPWTARGSHRGYRGRLQENALISSNPMPLSFHEGAVYTRERDVIPRVAGNFSGPMRYPWTQSSRYMTIADALQTHLAKGEIYAFAHLTTQFNRALVLSYEGLSGDYDTHDAALLRMFYMTTKSMHHNQYTPLASYRLALSQLHDVMYQNTNVDHMGKDPFDPLDEELDARYGPSFHADSDWLAWPGHTATGTRVRGTAFAARTASDAGKVCDSELYPLLCRKLPPGQGRGPLPVTEVGTLEYDMADIAGRQRSAPSRNAFIEKNAAASTLSMSGYGRRLNRAAREVFGNIISAGMFTLMSTVYATTGPYTAMVSSYAKSFVSTDFFSVQNRRKLWIRQREELRLQQHEYEPVPPGDVNSAGSTHKIKSYNSAEGSPVVHWITMASKASDRLHNLRYTAQLAGIDLKVVGMRPEGSAPSDGEFNYSDKVKAFHEYLEANSRSGLSSIDLASTERERLPIADNDLIVLIDAYDVLILPNARKIGRRFQQTAQHPIIFCVENGVYPEYPSASVYQRGDMHEGAELDTSLAYDPALAAKFLNSGCVIGRAGQMRAMVYAAHVNGDAFRNDQQFYTRYQLSYPDIVGLDMSQQLFMTGQKQLTCQTMMLVDNDLSFRHVMFSNARAFSYEDTAAEAMSVVSEVGVFHANNLASNRLYEILTSYLSRAVTLHLNGPDQNWLLGILRASADEDWNHAAFLLLTAEVQRNSTSAGGSNLLPDLLTVKHADNLLPALVRLLRSEHIASSNNRSAYSEESAVQLASGFIAGAREAVRARSEQAAAAAAAEKLSSSPREEGVFDSGVLGVHFVRGQVRQILHERKSQGVCHGSAP